jgi:hypothetical protein
MAASLCCQRSQPDLPRRHSMWAGDCANAGLILAVPALPMCFYPYWKRGFEGECHAMPQRFRRGRRLTHQGASGALPLGRRDGGHSGRGSRDSWRTESVMRTHDRRRFRRADAGDQRPRPPRRRAEGKGILRMRLSGGRTAYSVSGRDPRAFRRSDAPPLSGRSARAPGATRGRFGSPCDPPETHSGDPREGMKRGPARQPPTPGSV